MKRFFSSVNGKMTPENLIAAMSKSKINRAYLISDPKSQKVTVSNNLFSDFAQELQSHRDFDKHEAIFLALGKRTNALLSAVLHNTTRGPGAGGVRYWKYPSLLDFVRDGLRLSQGMGRKNSLAGLWWGGGKGVIAQIPSHSSADRSFRNNLFQDYGEFMTSLKGCYVTAEDLGVTTEDVDQVFSKTRFTTCISAGLGGSGNPSIPTARGVISGMEGALAYLKQGDLTGKTIAVQGTGNVARYMIAGLVERGVRHVYAVDVNPVALEEAAKLFKGKQVALSLVQPGDNSILAQSADIFSPCATGGILNPTTIPTMKAKIVCGAANNQLLDDTRDDKLLQARGITYVPDFLANRMGIVTCANEQYGYVENDPAIHRHFEKDGGWSKSIFNTTKQVLDAAKHRNTTTSIAANEIADNLMKENHPIWPERSRQIIQSLVNTKWHLSA